MSELRLSKRNYCKRGIGVAVKSSGAGHWQVEAFFIASMVWLGCALAFNSWAGGTGLNVVVVANQNSSNSLELANYYCEARKVPPDNLLRIAWPGGNTSWSSSDFQNYLVAPLLNMLAARQLTNQIDYVVLSMDIPFQTVNANGTTINGTTSALFYGLKPVGGNWTGTPNSYYGSEAVFSQAKPSSAPGYSFLTVMITGDSLAHAKQLVDQGVASDGSFPIQPVVLAKSSDPARNIRYPFFDNAIFNVQLRGNASIMRTNCDSIAWGTNFMGFETGLANYTVPSSSFTPGAIADSLTSYGGLLFGGSGQTSLLAFLNAGASGSYGTVQEPLADPTKFPDPQVYFFQSRGFSLAESYYQSVNAPYLGLVVAEPLAAPCRQAGSGKWPGTNSHPVLSGTVQLPLSFSSPPQGDPLQQIDLFVDGKYFQTLTNVAPAAGNVLSVNLNGYPITYTVPANASLTNVASGLAAVINAPANTNITKVVAFTHGDRIELHSTSTNRLADPFYFTDNAATNGIPTSYRVTYLPNPFTPRFNLLGPDRHGLLTMHVESPPTVIPFLEASVDFATWLPILTSPVGGSLDLPVGTAQDFPQRFYRVGLVLNGPQPPLPPPSFTVLNPQGSPTLRIDGPVWPFTIESSTNSGSQWTSIFTNFPVGKVQITAGSAAGSASAATTFLNASSKIFPESSACAYGPCWVNGRPAVGDWVQFNLIKTNGNSVAVAVTNQTSGARAFDLIQQLYSLINLNASLQGSDGVFAETITTNLFTKASFNVRARGAGTDAAAVRMFLTGAGSSQLSPSSPVTLTANLSDVQPRNHLYVSAGTGRFLLNFPLDTTTLADGFHELSAVAYEGSSVRTQAKVTLPVTIQNSSLTATLTPLDFGGTAPLQGTYHIQVVANGGNISSISLFSTGGLWNSVSNQSSTTFSVDGPTLGAGLHGFYAIVQTSTGQQYRTDIQSVRLVSGQ